MPLQINLSSQQSAGKCHPCCDCTTCAADWNQLGSSMQLSGRETCFQWEQTFGCSMARPWLLYLWNNKLVSTYSSAGFLPRGIVFAVSTVPGPRKRLKSHSGSHLPILLTDRIMRYLKLGNSRSHFSQRYNPFCWSITFLLQSWVGQAWYIEFSLRRYTTVATELK